MKRTIVYCWLLVFPCILWAQEGNVTVLQSSEVAGLLESYKAYNERSKLANGYRLQIMFSNDRTETYNAKAKLYKDFPSENCYVEYEQPYYKLRLGDYANRFEATYMLNKILSLYPGAFLVKDKVQIK